MNLKKNMVMKREDFGILYNKADSTIYVFGGYSYGTWYNSAIPNCEKYSVENDEWMEIKPMSCSK